MILLNRHSSDFEKLYFDKIWDVIQSDLTREQHNFIKMFPESVNTSGIEKEFFKDIILLSIEDAKKKYNSVMLYYNITYIFQYDFHERLKTKFGKNINGIYRNTRSSCYDYINNIPEIKIATTKYLAANSIKKIDICRSKIAWKKYIDSIIYVYETIYGSVSKIFNYEKNISSKMKAEIVKDLNISVCPYCNRQYINVFIEAGRNRTIADIDHFLPKEHYSLWADSLYNMIPSCKVCNMLFKGKRNIDMFNPFQRGYENEAYFTIEHENELTLNELMGWTDRDVEISLKFDGDGSVCKKIQSEAELFRIKEVYRIHSDYVKDLLYKQAMIEKTITEEMIEEINEKTEAGAITIDEVKRVLYGMDLDDVDYCNIPLSKLTYDILRRKNI